MDCVWSPYAVSFCGQASTLALSCGFQGAADVVMNLKKGFLGQSFQGTADVEIDLG